MKNGGGPAFPVQVGFDENGEHELQTGHHSVMRSGMTLRDYFAAAALQGLLTGVENPHLTTCAKMAYDAADDMLKVREAPHA